MVSIDLQTQICEAFANNMAQEAMEKAMIGSGSISHMGISGNNLPGLMVHFLNNRSIEFRVWIPQVP